MTRSVPNRQIAEEAADWVIRLDGQPLQPAEREALAAWLRASPIHVEELLFSASIFGGLAGVDGRRELSIDDLLAQAAPEVIPLFRAPLPTPAETPVPAAVPARGEGSLRAWSARKWAVAAALAVAALTGIVLSRPAWQDGTGAAGDAAQLASRTYSTDLGEHRSITLADGSVIYLNTSSSMRVSMSASERRIELMRGEGLFEVAFDSARPFRVHAAGAVAQALGTKFNVRHTSTGVQVAVVEGKVLVDSRATPPGRAALTPAPSDGAGRFLAPDQALLTTGQQARLERNVSAPLVEDADLLAVTSWRMRQLSFDDAPLSEIVAEFNRYNRTPIVLAGHPLGETRLSGVFDANDPDSFIDFLELSSGVVVDRSETGRILLRPREN